MKRKIGDIQAIPFRGGVDTVREHALIQPGGYSMVQNMRNRHPGMEQRKGCAVHSATADTAGGQVVTLYQFSKGQRTERALFAQMGDHDILSSTGVPPTAATAGFGAEIFSSTGTMIPCSWSHVDDICIMSNGIDQHKVYAGLDNHVGKFIKFTGSAAPPAIPDEGTDYTKEVTDGDDTTVAILDSFTSTGDHCLFINTPVRANRLTFTMASGKENSTTGTTASIAYIRQSDGIWAGVTEVDGTSASGATLGQSGAVYWTFPNDEVPSFMYGTSGYWYRWTTDAALDGEVEVSAVTYGTDGSSTGTRGSFASIENVWDGNAPFAIEARHDDNSESIYYTYPSDSIEIDEMTSSDKIYFNSIDPIIAIYVDVGETPNTTASTTINEIGYHTGDAWRGVAGDDSITITDETNGMANSGWITWVRTTNKPKPIQFQNAKYYSYWYYFTVDKTLSDDVLISIETMPYFDIEELGKSKCSSVWKDRAIYTFDRHPEFLYISAMRSPLYLNGDDYGILQAGDGRSNAVVCMRKFHNELMVFQEEKGHEGGCLTLFEGYSPQTFGKLVLSNKIGTFNSKSVVVVDGVMTSTATDETLKTLAFFLSRYGVAASDGRTVTLISDKIQNYFDPADTTNCIRRGYEKEHWLEYDAFDNVLRIGLVTGSSATVPNTFLVFDLVDKTWSFDSLAQPLSCMVEVEAASGNISVLQYGGGTADGFVYRLNTGSNDVSTPIDGYVTIELASGGMWLFLRELLILCKVQGAGDIIVTPYQNSRAKTAITLSMTYETSGDAMRRHRIGTRYEDSQMSLKIQNATVSESLYLLSIGYGLYVKEGR